MLFQRIVLINFYILFFLFIYSIERLNNHQYENKRAKKFVALYMCNRL
jgi:hypothetical protein